MRKNQCMGMVALCLFLCSGFFSPIARAAEFTADLTITSSQNRFVYDLKVKDNKMRVQKIKGPPTAPPFPTIYNRTTRVTWGLNPQIHQYIEETDPARTIMLNPIVGWEFMRKNMKETPGGKETVEGYPCHILEYRKPGTSRVAHRVWFSKDLGFVVKEIAYGLNTNATMRLTHIKKGPVNESLFQVPAGYTLAGKPVASSRKGPKPSSKPGKSRSKDEPITSVTPRSISNAASVNIIFILDASGSMWGKVDGKAKIAIAKEVLTRLIQDLPDNAKVGLVAYGHRRKGDCNDVEELIPLGPLHKKKLIARIQSLSPKGKTPISRSVRLTADRIKHLEDKTTIILVSDGKETCDPDPCGLVKELKAAGIQFILHVIGFDVTEAERQQLACMAQAGGGEYYTAGNAGEFLAAAREVVEAPTFKGGYLKVTSVKDGQPFEASVHVYRQSDRKHMGSKSTWSHQKPAQFKLAPGAYTLAVTDRSVTPYQTKRIQNVHITAGQTVEKTVTFGGAGTLQITAVKDGKPFQASVTVYRQDDKKNVGSKGTWSSKKPAIYTLVPGVYRLRITDRSVTPYQTKDIPNVRITAGQTVEKTVTFGGAGTLQITAVKDGKPFQASVTVYRQDDKKNVGSKGTWSYKKPAIYKLVPGRYSLKVTDRSVSPYQTQEIRDINITSGQTVEKTIPFVAGGMLIITAVKDGKPFQASVTVYSQDDKKNVGSKGTWSNKKPAIYTLVPGRYRLKITDRSVKPYQTQEIRDINIVSGKTVKRVVGF